MTADRTRLEEIVSGLYSQHIAVVGDFMLDQYVWGQVARISPEAPVPVVQVVEESFTPGGAGNVLMNIIALGGNPIGFGIVGKDAAGQRILETLEKNHLNGSAHVLVDASRPTTVKTRVVAHNQHVVRIDKELLTPVDEVLHRRMLDSLESEMPRFDAVIVSDYNKGVITRNFFDEVVKSCLGANVPILLDPKVLDLRAVGPIMAITPNDREAERLSGIPISDLESVDKAGRALLAYSGAKHILITRGERGMALFSSTQAPVHLPTRARQVYDITGAGDTVVAILAMAVGAGASMIEAAQLANLGAGIVVGRVGTATVSREELLLAVRGEWPSVA
jgi:D-beta-D-heptose 7-phosphate kinase/D-beta-D-heptose 1-phosphate adenosyltransferase